MASIGSAAQLGNVSMGTDGEIYYATAVMSIEKRQAQTEGNEVAELMASALPPASPQQSGSIDLYA